MTPRFFLVSFYLLTLLTAACGGTTDTPPDDTQITDTTVDTETSDTIDTRVPPPPDIVLTTCESDSDCDDDLFCNGEETCLPDHVDSDDKGCLAGDPPKSTDDNSIDCRTILNCDEDIDDFPVVNLDPGAPCDDGIACTTTDICDAFGNCQGTLTDSQCDDGLFCNGVETCAFHIGCKAGAPPTPAPEANPDPTDCLVPSLCVEATQSFDMAPAPAGTPCNDNVPCTFEDACTGAGTCGGLPNDGFCDDGEFCNGSEFCDATDGCGDGTAPEAPEDTDLTDCVAPTLCDEATDAFTDEPVAAGTACDDGEACLENDQCDSTGTCSGTAVICDSNADTTCSINTCDDTTGTCAPVSAASDTTCDDNSSNSKDDVCDGSGQCGGTAIVCPDATTCTPTWTPNGVDCTPTHASQGTACDDGVPGTTDQCDGQGTCTSAATLCAANQFVSANACVACPAGTTNAAGDDASGADTACDATACPKTNAKIGWTTWLTTKFHDVQGIATIVDDCTIVITNFFFDGNGINVKLYGALDEKYSVGFPIGPQLFNFPVGYDNETLSFTLPADKTMDDLNSISVWCVAASISFGDGVFIAP